VREDLNALVRLVDLAEAEAPQRGVNSIAVMVTSPAADPEAWAHRALSAMFGRVDAAYLEDNRDEGHPTYVLGSWAAVWREHLGQPTDLPNTLGRAHDYLDTHLTHMAEVDDPSFEVFAKEISTCRARLEDALRAGEREELGAPCPRCAGQALVKHYGPDSDQDYWTCPKCEEWWSDQDYRSKVAATYELLAPALPASAIRRVYHIPEGSTRGWAAKDQVRKRGKDSTGRVLYDVSDVLSRRDRVS
jgi:transposase-like protein